MRWIQHSNKKIYRGDTSIPDGDAFFVDEKGSMALVKGRLYIDGKPAITGRHTITFGNGDVLPVDVDTKGRATRRPIERGGK
jgi:hypothetical protein